MSELVIPLFGPLLLLIIDWCHHNTLAVINTLSLAFTSLPHVSFTISFYARLFCFCALVWRYDSQGKITFKQSDYELAWMETYPQLRGKTEPVLILFLSTYLVKKDLVLLFSSSQNKEISWKFTSEGTCAWT